MLRVKDIMTRKVYTVNFDASAEEAAWGLTRRQIGAAPVRNKGGELVGMLTSGDLVDPEPQQWLMKEPTWCGDATSLDNPRSTRRMDAWISRARASPRAARTGP